MRKRVLGAFVCDRGLVASRLAVWLVVPLLAWSAPVLGSNFQVIPIKLYMSPQTKTAVVRVINKDDHPLTIQVDAKAWHQQGAEGEDVYVDAPQILFFPQIFTVAKDQEQVVRVGFKGARPPQQEETFRLYLEELPLTKPGKTELRLALRIGVPIFIQPPADKVSWRVEPIPVSQGAAGIRVTNEGSRHLVIERLTAVGRDSSGHELLNKSRDGWYVLAGSTRAFPLPLDEALCRRLATLTISVTTGKETRKVEVPPLKDPQQCVAPPVPPHDRPAAPKSAN
jgi:fimbrial chaperone protein